MAIVSSREFGPNCPYKIFTADSDPTDFPVFASLKETWDNRKAGDMVPAWNDFEFEDFRGWHGWLALSDIVSTSPFDAVYRLWGTNWTDLCSADFTGRHYSEQFGSTDNPSNTQADLEEQLLFWGKLSQTTHIALGHGVMTWLNPEHMLFNRDFQDLTLPLSSDGKTPDKYLTVLWVDGFSS